MGGGGLVGDEEGLERRVRGVEPWRKWVVVVEEEEEESLRECNGGRWRSEAVSDIFFFLERFWILGSEKLEKTMIKRMRPGALVPWTRTHWSLSLFFLSSLSFPLCFGIKFHKIYYKRPLDYK